MTQKQMQQFKIKIDLSKVYQEIKTYKLREYRGSFPTIKLTAQNPDQACFTATSNLLDLLCSQGAKPELVLKVRNSISIKSLKNE